MVENEENEEEVVENEANREEVVENEEDGEEVVENEENGEEELRNEAHGAEANANTDYRMNHPRRGFHIIFAHELFDNEVAGPERLQQREGTREDVDALIQAYTHLGFENRLLRYFSRGDLQDILCEFACYDHSDHDCLAVTVLTHGNGKELFARDASFCFDEIWRPFQAQTSRSLAGKPKLFVIQACRGGENHNPGVLDSDARLVWISREDVNFSAERMPTQNDFIWAFSTSPGNMSWRHPSTGSIFIQALCKVILADRRREQDWVTLLEQAKHETSELLSKNYPGYSQCPSILSTLTGRVRFPLLSSAVHCPKSNEQFPTPEEKLNFANQTGM